MSEILPIPQIPDEETCWQAVQQRDARYNGVFYYAVRSTGVYCLPGCASRPARRSQMRYFAAPADAEAAGFRPCKRCQPSQSVAPQAELVAHACRLLEEAGGPLPLADLARQLAVSPYHLARLFKHLTGVTPHQYAAALRLEQFKTQVRRGEQVASALYAVGYGSSSRLYEKAAQRLGMTPAAYQHGGQNMEISYTLVDCDLGRLLVAGTEKGICALSFGDDDAEMESFLRLEYPAARLQRDDRRLGEWVRQILAHLDGLQPHLDLPLDVRATAFQLRVWDELRRIPYGETRTYSEVAAAIGSPAAVRAVAHACASNPVSVVTPCHRVVRSDGSLAGYRWGLPRKAALLEREKDG